MRDTQQRLRLHQTVRDRLFSLLSGYFCSHSFSLSSFF